MARTPITPELLDAIVAAALRGELDETRARQLHARGAETVAFVLMAMARRLADRKAATLQRKVTRLLPHLKARPAFAWAGTFAETRDGLPLFGRHPHPLTRLFAFTRLG